MRRSSLCLPLVPCAHRPFLPAGRKHRWNSPIQTGSLTSANIPLAQDRASVGMGYRVYFCARVMVGRCYLVDAECLFVYVTSFPVC